MSRFCFSVIGVSAVVPLNGIFSPVLHKTRRRKESLRGVDSGVL